ncbi:MAG TPA: CBS domain-containing protein [Kofleriaceae bacterium]|jgi:CBS domain-containing protein
MRRLEQTIDELGYTRQVPQLARTERVSRAFELMSRDVHDCVLVVDHNCAPLRGAARPGEAGACGGRLEGIFTSRDFLNRVAAVRADPKTIALGDVMTPAPRTLRPRDGVVFAINWMAVEGFRNVPIVDDDGAILGVLTVWDVMRHLGNIFDEIDATPRPVRMQDEVSAVVNLIDLGGGG